MKLCLVCSSGGHFLAMYNLQEFWKEFEHFWVTFLEKDDTPLLCDSNLYNASIPEEKMTPLLCNERSYNAFHPTNRNIPNLLRNAALAYRILKKEKPDVILSTGAGVAVPFIYLGKLLGIKTVYVELATRVSELSLTGFLVYPVVDHLLVQWPEMAKKYKKAKFAGVII
jgi:beta-1,4-N-acetylglucosaminyltransferase